VPRAAGGLILRVLLNADEDRAVGFLASPGTTAEPAAEKRRGFETAAAEDHSRWRVRMAERIAAAAAAAAARFGVRGFYLFGSAKNGTAGPGSDINLLVHFSGTGEMRRDLLSWLEGWSLSLAEANYLRTGMTTAGLLDVHIVTDEDLKNPTGYAAKIGAVTDAARPLPASPS
jgi:predicted nucleotidyltransferase